MDHDPLHDPDDFLSLLASSGPMTFRVPDGASFLRPDDRRHNDGSHPLAGATITYWPTHQPEEINR